MKKIIIAILLTLLVVTGCTKDETNNTINAGNEPDHKIYKYMLIKAPNTSGLIYSAYIFDDPSTIGYQDDYYKPTLLVTFDTKTGKATSVKLYAFFLDYEDDEWVNKSIEKFNEAGNDTKKKFTNLTKGRVNDNVSYLTCDIDPFSYSIEATISTYLIENQDIEKYKNYVYYDRLYNYDPDPAAVVTDNSFYETITDVSIEYSDKELKAF